MASVACLIAERGHREAKELILKLFPRGRPLGTGEDDEAALRRMALLVQSGKSIREAARTVAHMCEGNSLGAIDRRLRRKFSDRRIQLLQSIEDIKERQAWLESRSEFWSRAVPPSALDSLMAEAKKTSEALIEVSMRNIPPLSEYEKEVKRIEAALREAIGLPPLTE